MGIRNSGGRGLPTLSDGRSGAPAHGYSKLKTGVELVGIRLLRLQRLLSRRVGPQTTGTGPSSRPRPKPGLHFPNPPVDGPSAADRFFIADPMKHSKRSTP